MRKTFKLLSVALMLLMTLQLFAQERSISGTVISDTGTPLEGVTVSNSTTNKNTTTNATGSFSIQASGGQELVFTYVGYISSRIVVGNTNNCLVLK